MVRRQNRKLDGVRIKTSKNGLYCDVDCLLLVPRRVVGGIGGGAICVLERGDAKCPDRYDVSRLQWRRCPECLLWERQEKKKEADQC